MAAGDTRLSDLIEPAIWSRYQFEENVEKLDIFQAGLLQTNDMIAENLGADGRVLDIPAFDDLASGSSEPVNDDPNDEIATDKVATRQAQTVRHLRAKAWSNMDVNKIIIRDDPMKVINDRISNWWQRATKRTAWSIITGVFADNSDNDSSDLIQSPGTSITAEDVIDAAFLQGDMFGDFVGIWMHSTPYKALVKADLIDFAPDSEGKMTIPKYLGLRVVVDDFTSMVSGTSYTSLLFKMGAMHYQEFPWQGMGGPVEDYRTPKAGHGGGQTEVITRRNFVMHPIGFSMDTTSFAAPTPADTELDNSGTWDRYVASLKHTGMVQLITVET